MCSESEEKVARRRTRNSAEKRSISLIVGRDSGRERPIVSSAPSPFPFHSPIAVPGLGCGKPDGGSIGQGDRGQNNEQTPSIWHGVLPGPAGLVHLKSPARSSSPRDPWLPDPRSLAFSRDEHTGAARFAASLRSRAQPEWHDDQRRD